MGVFYLPVPEPPPDQPDMTAQQWETATGGPTPSGGPTTVAPVDGPQSPHGGSVAMYRTGPGDYGTVDQWMGEDIYIVPRDGVMNGEQLFNENVAQPPNEGHGEYDFAQDGPKIDHSTRLQALFWSDWNASTSLISGGRGAFTGQHVVIARAVPGSTQGYMPTETAQRNNTRDMPGPWDEQLAVAREDYIASMRAATSVPQGQGVNG